MVIFLGNIYAPKYCSTSCINRSYNSSCFMCILTSELNTGEKKRAQRKWHHTVNTKTAKPHIVSVQVPVYLFEYIQTDRKETWLFIIPLLFFSLTLCKVLERQQLFHHTSFEDVPLISAAQSSSVLRCLCAFMVTQENNLTHTVTYMQSGAVQEGKKSVTLTLCWT